MPAIKLDIENAINRMGGKDLFLEIAHSFAAAIPLSVEELRAELNSGDIVKARRLAHSLKSNCAAMGAEEVRLEAYEVEKACANNDEESARRAFAVFKTSIEELRQHLLALR